MKVRLVIAVLALSLASRCSRSNSARTRFATTSFVWQVYPTPHFRISFYDREAVSLPKLASFAESAYDELARRLNYQSRSRSRFSRTRRTPSSSRPRLTLS
jgi:hypothetical protein